ncbi:MAG: hypothetical protein Q9174_001513 [Haloplaca sp. 1 TL-2023]
MGASSMPSSSEPLTFFHLPRELRDTIYHYYLFEPEGYHYHLDSGKLRTKDNRSIDLNLMYTCSAIAAETHHLPFRCNILHFSTSEYPSQYERATAERFDHLLKYIREGKKRTLDTIKYPPLAHYRTPSIDAELTLRYPQLAPVLHLPNHMRRGYTHLCEPARSDSSTYGEPDSLFSAFQDNMIHLLSETPGFRGDVVNFLDTEFASHVHVNGQLDMSEELRDFRAAFKADRIEGDKQTGRNYASHVRSVLSMSHPQPWTIPSIDEMSRLHASACQSDGQFETWGQDYDGVVDRIRWRFSAAAATIRFFQSISKAACLGLNKVVLHENRISVAASESHALGLIPFCQDNPQLHIERRIGVWGVLMSQEASWFRLLGCQRAEQLVEHTGLEENDMQERQSLCCSLGITNVICRWITEASALFTNGMPARSFSLVFDGDPSPTQSSDLFEIIKEDAAWQVAEARWYADRSIDRTIDISTRPSIYRSKVFPAIIDEIVEGKSFISCNFPTGTPFNPQPVLNITRTISYGPERARRPQHERDLDIAWLRQRRFMQFNLSPPLPPLSELFLHDLIPEEQSINA